MTETAKARSARRLRGDEGGAMVEAPLVLIVVAFLALGVLAFVEVMRDYQHLTSATRAAARYASKSEYDPTLNVPSAAQRPDTQHVYDMANQDAAQLTPPANLTFSLQVCTPGVTLNVAPNCTGNQNNAGQIGQMVTVRGSYTITNGAYNLVSGLSNGLAGFFGGGDVLPKNFTIHSEAAASYE